MTDQESNAFKLFCLHDIADWQNQPDKSTGFPVHIPAIQRGLVWNATQAEILWDSLMRGIPIGTFTLIRSNDGDCFELLDGQQRANAIAMGFRVMPRNDDSDEVKQKPLLWIDLKPSIPEGSRCKFVFRVTTPGQPWGYRLPTVSTENSSNRLDTEQRRKVLVDNKIDSSSMVAKRPFPLEILRPHGTNNPVLFSSLLDGSYPGVVPDEIRHGIANIKNTKIFALCSPLRTTDDDWLPTFFTRMNKQGVEPDQEEILYSNTKCLVPELKKADEFARGRGMRASRMANIMLRVYFSEHDNKWISGIDLKKVRQIKNVVDINQFIGQFSKRLERLDSWCSDTLDTPIPPVTISMFAMRHPAVYQWLLLMARDPCDGQGHNRGKFLLGCATVLAWFYLDGQEEEACKFLYQSNVNGSLLPLVNRRLLTLPPHPEEIPNGVTFPFTKSGGPYFDQYILSRTVTRMSRIWNGFDHKEGCELLMFACREYMNVVFPRHGLPDSYWQEDNRPWDYDHIVPKSWLASGQGNPQGPFHALVAKYLWSIGNSTPIPFSVNRSKGAKELDGNYCGEMQSALYLDKNYLESFKKGDRLIECDEEKTRHFVAATSVRLSKLYYEWYTSIDIGSLFDCDIQSLTSAEPSALVRSRRETFLRLKETAPILKLKVYAVIGRHEYCLEENNKEQQKWWFLPWLSIGTASSDGKSYIAITTNGKTWEVGLRKHPELTEVDSTHGKKLSTPDGFLPENRDWWYYVIREDRNVQSGAHEGICMVFKQLTAQLIQGKSES